MQSLLSCIEAAIVDGELPEDFSLPHQIPDDEVAFADGAKDGIEMYHMPEAELSAELRACMEAGVLAASDHDYERADAFFAQVFSQTSALSIIDELQAFCRAHFDELKRGNIYEYAIGTMGVSDDREMVKLGLSLLELFVTDSNEELKGEVRTLGLCDEFTLFALYVMRSWPNGNDEIFQLAKKVHGWGRIFCVEFLEPETDEIRNWLLTEGSRNYVMPEYSALTCWKKSGAQELLAGELTFEQFEAIRELLVTLMHDGPVEGLTGIEGIDWTIGTFIAHADAKSEELSLEDYAAMADIRELYARYGLDWTKTWFAAGKILLSYRCWVVAKECVLKGEKVDLAMAVNFPSEPYLLDHMRASFEKNYGLCEYFADDSEHLPELYELYREKLPLEQMKTGPSTEIGLGEQWWRHWALEPLMQKLRAHPLEGADFVECGLMSEPVRTRSEAVRVLEHWVARTRTPLAELSAEFCELLGRLRGIEPKEGLRSRMDALVAGATEFENVILDGDAEESDEGDS